MNFISLDVSSTIIGYSKFELNNDKLNLLDIGCFKLNNNFDIFKRFDEFESYIYKQTNIDYYVLEARLKSFMPGNSSKNALLAVAAANEICSYICYKKCKNVFKFHPSSIRASVGLNKKVPNIKLTIIEFVYHNELLKNYLINNQKTINEIFPMKIISKGKRKGQSEFISGASDIADSFVIGLSSQILIKKNKLELE